MTARGSLAALFDPRAACAWAAIVLPIAIAVGVDEFARLFLPGPDEISRIRLAAAAEPGPGRLIAEAPARMRFVFASLLVTAAAAAGFVHALRATRAVPRWTVALVSLAIGLGVFFAEETPSLWLIGAGPSSALLAEVVSSPGFSAGEVMRLIAIDHVFAEIGAPPAGPAILWLSAVSTLIVVTAVAALATCFAAAAWRSTGDAASLRRRKRLLQTTLALGAGLLTLSVAANRAFYHWPLAMLEQETAKAYGDMVSMAAGYWGLLYTLVLIAAAAPAVLALRADIAALAARQAPSEREAPKWIEEAGLRFAPKEGLVAALATAAPVLTSPFLDILATGIA